jgi:4-hydroxy-2-oxoheptanedioate aldolase
LRRGEAAYGTLIFSQDPSITEIVGFADFDVCVIDLEHAANTIGDFMNHARAAAVAGKSCWARVGENSKAEIGRLLDAGAQGIILPHYGIDPKADEALRGLRYAPDGERPTCTVVRATKFGKSNFTDYAACSNDAVMGIGLIEDSEAVERIDEIIETTALDAVMPGGGGDLAASLGVPGQSRHPSVLAAIERVVTAARRRTDLRVGVYISDMASIADMKALHADFYLHSIDYKIILGAFQQLRSRLQEEKPASGKTKRG